MAHVHLWVGCYVTPSQRQKDPLELQLLHVTPSRCRTDPLELQLLQVIHRLGLCSLHWSREPLKTWRLHQVLGTITIQDDMLKKMTCACVDYSEVQSQQYG